MSNSAPNFVKSSHGEMAGGWVQLFAVAVAKSASFAVLAVRPAEQSARFAVFNLSRSTFQSPLCVLELCVLNVK